MENKSVPLCCPLFGVGPPFRDSVQGGCTIV